MKIKEGIVAHVLFLVLIVLLTGCDRGHRHVVTHKTEETYRINNDGEAFGWVTAMAQSAEDLDGFSDRIGEPASEIWNLITEMDFYVSDLEEEKNLLMAEHAILALVYADFENVGKSRRHLNLVFENGILIKCQVPTVDTIKPQQDKVPNAEHAVRR